MPSASDIASATATTSIPPSTATIDCVPAFNPTINPSVVMTPLLKHFIESTPDPEGARRGFATLNPLPGMVTVDAVAKAALFLVSDDAAFITAVALPIDGGYTAR